jgi:hypothetical protein
VHTYFGLGRRNLHWLEMLFKQLLSGVKIWSIKLYLHAKPAWLQQL